MIDPGTRFTSKGGRDILIGDLITVAGQAEIYHATDSESKQDIVAKVFHEKFYTDKETKRLESIIRRNLSSVCPLLCPPIDMIMIPGRLAHYCPFVHGKTLEEYLANPQSNFMEAMQLAITVAHAFNALHRLEITHGDIHSGNIILSRDEGLLKIKVIDMDNFNAPECPAPSCAGHNLYMAPELRIALKKDQPVIPTLYTDRFSLGLVIHETLLLRHVCTGADDSESKFHQAMCCGQWQYDPSLHKPISKDLGGYPAEILNTDLKRLFRRTMSLIPEERPSAQEWETELSKAFHQVYCCPKCGSPNLIDTSKQTCPMCQTPYPYLALKIISNNQIIPLKDGATLVGRSKLGCSSQVSMHHAVFRRIGPETWMESTGRNGTYRWNGKNWSKLPHKKAILVQKGDHLRMADIETSLVHLLSRDTCNKYINPHAPLYSQCFRTACKRVG